LNEAFSAADGEEDAFELAISSAFVQAWRILYEVAVPVLRGTSAVSAAEATRIKQMLAFIHSHASEPITAPMIAGAANVCTREAFRCFRSVLGTTPNAYLVRHRVNAAARLLIETDLAITEISASCGFSSPSYFCKVFSQILGKSPREFRKNRFYVEEKRNPD